MKTSIFRRLVWVQAIALGIPLAIASVFFVVFNWSSEPSKYDSDLARRAQTIASFLEVERNTEAIHQFMDRLVKLDEEHTYFDFMLPGEYTARYQIINPDGTLLYYSASAPSKIFTKISQGLEQISIDGELFWVLVHGPINGGYRVLVAESINFHQRLMWRNLQNFFKLYIAYLIPVVLSTWFLSRKALRPLQYLLSSLEARSPHDGQPLNLLYDIKEFRALVSVLNKTFLQASKIIHSQRDFFVDAAHELRTPLAVIGVQAHTLIHEADFKQREAIANDLGLSVRRAAELVQKLIAIARLEDIEISRDRKKFDIGALARDKALMMHPLALAKKQDLGIEGPEHLFVYGNESVLMTALENLIENAIRYTPHGGKITVNLSELNGYVLIEVEDNGPGISDEFKPKAFNRFTRGQGTTSSGSGLGLWIVRRAIELHAGTIDLRTPISGKGLLVRMEIPANEPIL